MNKPVDTGLLAQSQSKQRSIENVFSFSEIDTQQLIDDELIERTLAKKSVAMIYGASNSGKTFLSIDIAMSVATGIPVLGRNVVQKPVMYIAAEAPDGVRNRMRVWLDKHPEINKAKVQIGGGCHLYPHQIDLFGNVDVDQVISDILNLNHHQCTEIGLIVIDTLARVSGGANENSNDMSVVMSHCDRIKNATGATILLIHHSGKNEAQGARGWSGVRAAVDTEIEVIESDKTHIASITKQRDIEGKGDKFAYKLIPVPIGKNQWGGTRSTCYISPANLPSKINNLSMNQAMILEIIKNAVPALNHAEIITKTGKDYSQMRKVLLDLKNAGHIYEGARGAYFVTNQDEKDPI